MAASADRTASAAPAPVPAITSAGRSRCASSAVVSRSAWAASATEASTPTCRPLVSVPGSPASRSSSPSRAGVAWVMKMSRSPARASASVGGPADRAASISARTVAALPRPASPPPPPEPSGPITRAPLAACSSPWSADAVTNTALSRYSAGSDRHDRAPVSRTAAAVPPVSASSSARTAGASRGSRSPA